MSSAPIDENEQSLQQDVDDGLYTQNIDIDIRITKEDSGVENTWIPVELAIRRKTYSDADAINPLIAVPDPDENPDATIEAGDSIEIDAGPSSAIAEDGDRNMTNAANTRSRIFTGTISSARPTGEGTVKAYAFTSQLDIVKTKIDFFTETATTPDVLFEDIIRRVEEKAGIDVEFEVNLSGSSNEEYGISNFRSINESTENTRRDASSEQEFTDTPASEIIKKLAQLSNSVFWVDSNNVLQFGQTKTTLHKLSWIVETEAGARTPPFKSVKVIGDDIGTAGADGFSEVSNTNLLGAADAAEETVVSVVDEDGKKKVSFDELVEPTFVFQDESLRTRAQARNVAREILTELQSERGEGKIIIPGRPLIDLFDVVELPDSFGVISGGERFEPQQFIVEEVVHRMNSSDGFLTEITTGGLVNRYTDAPFYKYTGSGKNGRPLMKLIEPGGG
jgi:hypothetical protein